VKLRNKVLISIGLAWVLFLGLTYAGSKFFLLKSFLALEKVRANEDLGRVDQALDQVNYSLFTYTSDWSHWNDLYAFLQGKNPSFIPNNLNMTAYVNSHINFLSYWSKDGKLIVGTSIDTDNQKHIPFQKGLENYIFPSSKLLTLDVETILRGYIITEKGIMLIASSAATDGDKLLPPLGVMINARNLDAELVKKLSETAKVDLELLLPSQINQSNEYKKIFSTISGKDGHYSIPLNDDRINGYSIIKDINNKPIGMFKMNTPRYIYSSGLKAINYYLITFVALSIVFSILMVWLLRILIVKRLEKLDHEVANISEKKAIKERVEVTGQDEISSVSDEINHMLDIIQDSHEQLEQRVEERTQELKKTNIQLSEEINTRKSVEKDLIIHKENLIKLAHYDNLTALPNRLFFNEILSKAIHSAGRHKKLLAVIFVDLDRFKNINDAFGHTMGDGVLKEMGVRFSSILRAEDILARLGGDEFIILLNNLEEEKYAGLVAEKLLSSCTRPIAIQTHEFFISASIGISIFPKDGESLEALQKNADMAMYQAKHAGGGVYQYYTKAMESDAHEHIKLEAELRKAIQNNQFFLNFQPQLNLKTGKIERVEALIRWEHPLLGMISPAKFIPLAEETGLIMPIGEWTINEACRINKKWQNEGYEPVTIAINISSVQFQHQDVTLLISNALKEHDLEPKYIEIEITETAMMDNIGVAINKLTAISKMGIHISIDDFGTGYTSISYLKQFPVSILKIDQGFIKGLPSNQNDAAITTAVISLAHNLGLEVVAEGVETSDQMEFLINNNCDLIQGYFISRPEPDGKVNLQFKKKEEIKNNVS
jgi:diguanylate cyclase (GGDEF)-like protein